MFQNKLISSENATKNKKIILAEYEKSSKEYEFEKSMFQEYIDNIKNTEMLRIKLHKMLNGEGKEAVPITEERLCETINICMEILSKVFKGEF